MRRLLAGLFLGMLIFWVMGLVSADAQELKRLNLDDPAALGLNIQADASTKVEGKAAIKITTAWPTTVCIGEVSGLDIEEATLVYMARVKNDLEGSAYLEMWAHVGGGQYFSRGMNDAVSGKS